MGVHSLWDIVGPAARPVKLEALSRKRLAVDASIWIYQFMKAVRDKEGNSLGQTHIVGFFRRICKMLFYGMLPLFVFDGGAPPLKRQVIQARKERRQGSKENAASTAQKLLAMQLHRKAGKTPVTSSKSNGPQTSRTASDDSNMAYFDDLPMHHDETARRPPMPQESEPKVFRRKDEFHLPDLKQFTVRKGDQRIMPEGEIEEFGEEHSLDVVDGINIDSVDPSSQAFSELPMATQYMILNHLRLRSRLRLGYTKDQLEDLFPDSRDFSKFQIQQVQKRNYYTQKLMTVSGMGEETGNVTRRIAGDKDRQYMLVKNEGGWTLSLGGEKSDEAIDVEEDEINPMIERGEVKSEQADDSDFSDLEDVPLENSSEKPRIIGTLAFENNSDDEMLNKAVIESIYEQYKHDYDDATEPYDNDEDIQQRIAGLRNTDLKKAIEESKKDYYHQKSKEEKLTDADTSPEFEFGKSILFTSPETQNEKQLVVDEPQVDETIIDGANTNTGDHEDTESPEAADRRAHDNSLPSWFSDSSHLRSPHTSNGFLSNRQEALKADEDEMAGLIPWNEAREYLENVSAENDQAYQDVESVKEDSDSDLEILDVSPSETQIQTRAKEVPDSSADVASTTRSVSDNEAGSPAGANTHSNEGGFSNLPEEFDSQNHSNAPSTNNEKMTPSYKSPLSKKSRRNPSRKSNSNNKTAQNDAITESTNKANKQPFALEYALDESDEEDLVRQLREEEQDHVHFTSSIQMDRVPIHTKVSNEQLLQEQLQKAKRDAEEVTQTMINDVQELLKRFGIPYITAPMEAEAQCAELYQLGLVDGIVTDDSDCFLFGGSRIYKNMFNQKQYVECYIAEDIQHTVGIDQKKLIELALLLGSDYTEGVKGVGPVLAMEILAEFGSLESFKKWFDQSTKILSKPEPSDNTKLKKTLITRIKTGKLHLTDSFPDKVVIDAYKLPEVDHDNSEFKWGVPSLDQIRSFLMYNVGWSQEKVDDVMVPLIRNMNKTRTEGQQTTIGEFFPQDYISYRKDVGMGKRMKAAADRIRGE